MAGLGILFLLLTIVLAAGSLICWILVLIKIFKDNVGLGIVGIICSLFAFIYGWIKAKEYGIQKLMVWWTLLVIASIVVQLLGLALGVAVAAARSAPPA
jgi:hypothetical protein